MTKSVFLHLSLLLDVCTGKPYTGEAAVLLTHGNENLSSVVVLLSPNTSVQYVIRSLRYGDSVECLCSEEAEKKERERNTRSGKGGERNRERDG